MAGLVTDIIILPSNDSARTGEQLIVNILDNVFYIDRNVYAWSISVPNKVSIENLKYLAKIVAEDIVNYLRVTYSYHSILSELTNFKYLKDEVKLFTEYLVENIRYIASLDIAQSKKTLITKVYNNDT